MPAAHSDTVSGTRELLLLWAVFALLGLAVYAPSLHGEFLSDDLGYIVTNPYVHALTLENLRVLLDPFGEAARYTANYAPVHLLLHAVEWSVFGSDTFGWRVVNVLLHAGVAVLLVPVLLRAGVARAGAVFGALFFLLHPANVEVVAWIFQLKTILCLGFGAAAVLAHPKRPVLALLFFVFGILCKTTAAFALPVAIFASWRTAREEPGVPPRWGWLTLWAVAFALYSAPQLFVFQHLGEVEPGPSPELAVHVRTMLAIAGRYGVMAATSFGISTFQHPAAATSWLDPWWLGSIAIGVPLGLRALTSLVRARPEGGFWLWAAAGYAPVSQIFPFLYPMADRYLYVVLPGLLGVALLAGGELAERAGTVGVSRATRLRVAGLVACAVLALFAWRSFERAQVFRTNTGMMLDSARHFPDGLSGSMLRARRAAQEGDVEGTVAAIRRASELGFDGFSQLDEDAGLAPVRQDPRFRQLVSDVAGIWIERAHARGYATQLELRALAQAHAARSEWSEVVAVLERALATPGPVEAALRAELAEARRQLARAQRTERGGGDGAKAR